MSAADQPKGPPPIESIVAGVAHRADFGYRLGVDLGGLRGTWHRLWAALAMRAAFPDADAVPTVQRQFEGLLGRPLTASEWAALEKHATAHGHLMAARHPFAAKGSGQPGPDSAA